MSSVTRNPNNNSRHRVSPRKDRKMFSRTADLSHWWNFSNEVPRGGRRM